MKNRIIALSLAALLPLPAAAETFRCGKWVITAEMAVSELAHKCGEPTSRETRTEDIRARTQRGGVVKTGVSTTEIWTYDRGSSAAAMIVTIVDGAIKKIERQR
jgi:hypothetical protein